MTDRQILILKNSWSFVVFKLDETSLYFHNRMYRAAKNGSDLATYEDSVKFMSSITRLVSKLQLPEDFDVELRKLHLIASFCEIDFPQLQEVLLETIELTLHHKWTDEVKAAWIVFFQILSDKIK